MNNFSYYTFERNSYYNGKLLSVNDFETEQKYMNDKRRLTNRFLGGFGVICGLDVIAVSDDSISVEPGIAIDGYGREIVVSEPDVKKIFLLTGFDNGRSTSEYFVYIGYNEKPSELGKTAVYSDNNDKKYNKITEGYTLYLSNTFPQEDTGAVINYYRCSHEIIKNDYANITLIIPKYIKAAEKFKISFSVEPTDVTHDISMKLKINLTCIKYDGRDFVSIEFNSKKEKLTDGKYTIDYYCDSMNITEDMAVFEVLKDNFSLEIDGTSFEIAENIASESIITNRSIEECVMNNYSSDIMNYSMHKPFRDICIAKIRLKNPFENKIDRIEIRPFHQNIYTNAQLALENEVLKDRIDVLSNNQEFYENPNYSDISERDEIKISSGETLINLGIGGKAGKRFFSEEISHGLGIGNVAVILGIRNGKSDNGNPVYGSAEIFDMDEKIIKAETAVKLSPQEGTFIIGIRLIETTSEYETAVHWTAIRHKEKHELKSEKKIIIDCGVKSIRAMESVYFSIKFVNMNETDIRWSVSIENGGTINDNGYYTAPNQPGVYEIHAHCAYDISISTSAFVVVSP